MKTLGYLFGAILSMCSLALSEDDRVELMLIWGDDFKYRYTADKNRVDALVNNEVKNEAKTVIELCQSAIDQHSKLSEIDTEKYHVNKLTIKPLKGWAFKNWRTFFVIIEFNDVAGKHHQPLIILSDGTLIEGVPEKVN